MDKDILSLDSISSKDIICFSNLFKNGASSSLILSILTFTIHLKLSSTKEKVFVLFPTANLAYEDIQLPNLLK